MRKLKSAIQQSRKPKNPALAHEPEQLKVSKGIMRQVKQWRIIAVNLVNAELDPQKKIELAYKYYQADQTSMDNGMANQPWREMEKLIKSEFIEDIKKVDRDKLEKQNQNTRPAKEYKKPWLPTLQQLRDLKQPFIKRKRET